MTIQAKTQASSTSPRLQEQSKAEKRDPLTPYVFFALAFALLTAMAFWPRIQKLLPILVESPVVTQMGNVQKVRFVGGLAIRTEVETQFNTVILRGGVELARGEVVTRRVGPFDVNDLCVSRTGRCYEILSR